MLVFGINFILIKMFMGIRGNCKQMDESAFYRRCCIAVTKNAARLFIENDVFLVAFNSYTKEDHFDWDAFNEEQDLQAQAERFRELTGKYPELVQVDKIYLTRENRCKQEQEVQ